MNKTVLLVILALICMGLLVYFFRSKPNKDQALDEDYFISTEGETEDRVRSLALDKPSEDASSILDTSKLVFPREKQNYEQAEYKADPALEWIINLNFKNGFTLTKTDLYKIFDLEWRSNFPSVIYGFATKENRWTYAVASDSMEIFSKIQVAINLLEVFGESQSFDQQKLEKYFTELKKRIEPYQGKFDVKPSESTDQAIRKAKDLIELNDAFNQDAIIVLRGNKPFKGTDAWDALLSVGLKWGDGDLFHWENRAYFGHGEHFSVWTTTNPGYFLPESIKDGQMNPTDLVFEFSIPRSADPKNIFDAMVNTAKYCQKRLGGTILDKDSQPFNAELERKFIEDLIHKMQSKGITPGSDRALATFP
jgi:cell division protein ZipA